MNKKVTVVSETVSYAGKYLRVVDQQVELPNGSTTLHTTVQHPGAVVVLPIANDGRIIFVRQYRHSVGEYLLELPAGKLELGEEPRISAERELAEEIGFGAKKWISLGIIYPVPGFCDEKQHVYVAADLYDHSLPPDPDEAISVEHLSIEDVEAAIESGVMRDSKSIAIYCKAKLSGIFTQLSASR